jgi:FG-GAP-like repeat
MSFRILFVMTLLLSLLPMNADAQFYDPTRYARGGSGLGNVIVKADLNNDGNSDVVGLGYGNEVWVTAVLSNGGNGFLPAQNSPVTNLENPSNLTTGDFNGDGFPDVVMSGIDPVTGVAAIGIMLGNGDGTFQAANVFDSPVGGIFGVIVTGDFNGDGNIDVAVQGPTSDSITVYPGTGSGDFDPPITTTTKVDISSTCITAADFNKDGKLDVTTGTKVLLGNGNGTFQSPLGVPDGDCGVAYADLNHDGFLDLVTGSVNYPNVRVHLGDGTGKFDAGTSYITGQVPGQSIKIAAFTGSPDAPDIAVLNGGDSDITILLNQGDGVFKVGQTWNCGPACGSFVVGSFHQKNELDMVAPALTGLAIIRGNGNGTFQDELAQNTEPPSGQFLAADVNGDHKIDLVFTTAVEFGNGDGTFQSPIPFPTGCSATTVGDFNRDGKIDIAGPGPNSMGVAVCLGKGNGTFKNPVVYDQDVAHRVVLAGSFTNDGNLDLAASDEGGISILLGNGNGTFQAGIPTAVNGQLPPFVLGDFNNDGKLDVAAYASNPEQIWVLLGQGNGKFSAPVTSPGSYGVPQLLAGNMNKDGNLDLVEVVPFGVSILLGSGDGTFQEKGFFGLPNALNAVLGDFNLDGNLDIFVGYDQYDAALLRGDGNGGVASHTYYYPGQITGIATADFTGKKTPDIVVVGESQDTRLITFLNNLK